MTSRPALPRFILVALILLGIGVLIAYPRIERYFIVQLGTQQTATLGLAVQGLRGTLERYAPLPGLIADRPEIRAALERPNESALLERARDLLEQTAIALRATGVYLEDGLGNTLVAVPPLDPEATRERRYAARPYFNEAVAGGLGQYFALGTQSGERGYFYAAPVRSEGRITGVVAVRFSVDQFEATWQDSKSEIIVRDPNDVIFMASRADWSLKTLSPLSADARQRIASSRQYPLDQLQPLETVRAPVTDGLERVSIRSDDERGDFIASTRLIARAGWRVSILTPVAPAQAQARTWATLAILLLTIAGLVATVMHQRRMRLMERLESQRVAREMLEQRVEERTAELNTANINLRREVSERARTEERLRRTQAELVQAGKLAALGQMSAAISHEVNQPLAAIKAYADNALAYLGKSRTGEAEANLKQISSLADRISAISKHLRNFARRPQEKTTAVSVTEVVHDALALMEPRLQKTSAKVRFASPAESILVRGGKVRLQQVIVNLISNALDAMEDANADPQLIDIETEADESFARIAVQDTGPGLDPAILDTIFDPFVSSKAPGHGLGLGLSISYNIIHDFGGTISAENTATGARFVITLETAATEETIVGDDRQKRTAA